jgi:SDR family mycofactocin-dependent oxidoreductase
MTNLSGQVAIVTGAGRGQGRSHAIALAQAGAAVAICDIAGQIASIHYDMAKGRDLDETARLVKEAGSECLAVEADVRDAEQVNQFVKATAERFGRIDVLAANAGVWTPAVVAQTSDELWRDTIATNLDGVFHAIRAVSPHMIQQRSGRIIATSSLCGRKGTRNLGAYTASKWGVIGLVKTVAIELGEFGVTANAICPSYVDTDMINWDGYNRMFRPDLESPTKETSEEIVRSEHPLKVGSFPSQSISDTLLFLASPAAAMISGTAIDVTAGLSAGWSA